MPEPALLLFQGEYPPFPGLRSPRRRLVQIQAIPEQQKSSVESAALHIFNLSAGFIYSFLLWLRINITFESFFKAYFLQITQSHAGV